MSNPQNPTPPHVIGDLSEEENAQLKQLRQASDTIVMQLGRLRLQEDQVMQQNHQVQQQAQSVLNQAGARLGIPDGVSWQVTSEGKAILAPGASMPEAETPQPETEAPVAEISQPETEAASVS